MHESMRQSTLQGPQLTHRLSAPADRSLSLSLSADDGDGRLDHRRHLLANAGCPCDQHNEFQRRLNAPAEPHGPCGRALPSHNNSGVLAVTKSWTRTHFALLRRRTHDRKNVSASLANMQAHILVVVSSSRRVAKSAWCFDAFRQNRRTIRKTFALRATHEALQHETIDT